MFEPFLLPDCSFSSLPTPAAPGAAERVGARVHSVDDGREHVELLRVRVLSAVVLAADGAQHLSGHLIGLGDERLVLLGDFEIDRHDEFSTRR
ncbi:hypothetical protein LRS13_24515 [Svornostia abyssi]|uniref:Replication protein A3 n=1 Tax=Svornostia abyssi TaxID=2898438 RepID=A0ABY5PGL0_9ACTN|nr:hypothetical protein LRS13_24515 [Parviterribacteraceae bacterium J379]